MKPSLLAAVCLGAALLPIAADAQKAAAPKPSPLAPEFKVWSGDFDGMLQRRFIRVLMAYSKTQYYVVKGRQFGASYELVKAFEDYVNKKYPGSSKKLKFHVVFVPTPRDQLLPRLAAGKGDVAVAGLTVTPERQKLVAFSAPVVSGIAQIAVTGPASPELRSLDDLAGKEVFVRKDSSYWENLERLNARFKAEGKAAVRLRAAPGDLEDEDLLEMLNAGLVKIVVVNDAVAKLWTAVYTNIKPHPEIAISSGGAVAWALRKNTPKLEAAVNDFLKTHRQGTTFGNTILQRYYGSATMIKNATSEEDIKKFSATVDLFRKYASQYDVNYLLMMAMAYQESGLDQNVKSHVGAVGMMQLMPATGAAMQVGDIHDTETNIHAGVKYIRFMEDKYFADQPMDPLNKTLFAFAAYNAGPQRVRSLRSEAAKRGFDPNVWIGNVEVIAAERIGMETVTYVLNIYKYYIAYQLFAELDANKTRALQAPQAAKP